MKKAFYIKDSIENRITYYHLLFFLVTLPFDRIYSTLILVSFIIHSVIFLKLKRIQKIDQIVFIPQLVFFVTVISATYSLSFSDGLNTTGRQLAVFVFPVLFAITSLDLVKYRVRLMSVLTFTCTLIVIYLYYNALHTILYFKLPLKEIVSLAFVNQNFSEPLDMHPTYLSMLLVLSIVFSFSRLIFKSKYFIYYSGCCLILFAGLIQLGSKSAFLSLLIIVIFGFPWFLIKQKYRFKFMLTSLIITVFLITSMLSFQAFQNRYLVTLKNDLIGSTGAVNMNGRFDRWKVAIHLIEKAPLIGTGSGSEIPLLKDSYFRERMYGPYLFSLNAHNQYLSFLITSGILGLLVYLFTLSWGLWQSVKNKDVLLFSFIVLIALISLSEDLLDVNKGIFFYAFFFSFFIRSADNAIT